MLLHSVWKSLKTSLISQYCERSELIFPTWSLNPNSPTLTIFQQNSIFYRLISDFFLRFSNTVMTYVLKTCTYEMYFRYSKNKSLNIPVASTSFGPPDWAYQTNFASLQNTSKSNVKKGNLKLSFLNYTMVKYDFKMSFFFIYWLEVLDWAIASFSLVFTFFVAWH